MGRKRKKNHGWPRGWYQKGNAYYFKLAKHREVLGDKPIRLGNTLKASYEAFAKLPIHNDAPTETLAQLIERYVLEVLPLNAAGTRANKRLYLRTLVKVAGHFRPEEIEQHHAYSIFNKMKDINGLKTARETVGCLRHILSKAVEWGLIKRNLLLGMRLPKPKSRTRYISDDELKLFMDKYATKRIKAHLLFKLETGLDKQDILLVQLSDLKDDGVHTNRHKTEGKERVYEWTQELKDAVAATRLAYKGKVSSPYLSHTNTGKSYFPVKDGTVLDENGHPHGAPSGWNSQWQRCMKKWKADGHKGFHEHDVRKKVASDTDLENAQELLDHSDPRITEEVYRVKPKLLKLNSREALENEK